MSDILNKKQELLLQKLHDAETSIFSALHAKLLLKKSQKAKEYMRDLASLSQSVSDESQQFISDSADHLWGVIESRIAQEQKAELYLGARQQQITSDRRRVLSDFFSPAFATSMIAVAFVGGIYFKKLDLQSEGGAVPAALAVRSQEVGTAETVLSSSTGATLKLVSGQQEVAGRSQDIVRAPVVDWVKSAGRVHMIAGSTASHQNILWVKPPFTGQSTLASDRVQRATRDDKFRTINDALGKR